MININISNILLAKRKEKGITQDELATHMGVSKASVSKWETGHSYPDITILPKLASYYNISIDALIGYTPQMKKEDITKLYLKLSADFAANPFEEVVAECKDIVKAYYSCFPLILRMAILFVNHSVTAPTPSQKDDLLQEAVALCRHIRENSKIPLLIKNASAMESICYLFSEKPQKVLDLLGEEIHPLPQEDGLISQAYQMMGNHLKANEFTQIRNYQYLLHLLEGEGQFLLLQDENMEKVEEILHRCLCIAQLYHVDKLQPNLMVQIYYSAAILFCKNNNFEQALIMLEHYTDICLHNFFPLVLHGDDYFDKIQDWLTDLTLGSVPPRSESLIKESILQNIKNNPLFTPLKDIPRYQSIIERLENLV